MQYFLPITLEELKNLSDAEVVKRINDKIAPEIGTSMLSFPDFVSAQFYMAELDRRERRRDDAKRDESETRRRRIDLLLEGIVIGLIGLELIVAVVLFIVGGRQQSHDEEQQLKAFDKMQGVLTQMQGSSEATAATITQERQTMEAIETNIREELSLNYYVAAMVYYDAHTKRLFIGNAGRTSIYLWGTRVGKGKRELTDEGKQIAPGGTYDYGAIKATEEILKEMPQGSTTPIPFDIYVKNQNGEEYAITSRFVPVWQGPEMFSIRVQTVAIERRKWSKEK